jgi:hypothetical protein
MALSHISLLVKDELTPFELRRKKLKKKKFKSNINWILIFLEFTAIDAEETF